jgi:hypothetical protein
MPVPNPGSVGFIEFSITSREQHICNSMKYTQWLATVSTVYFKPPTITTDRHNYHTTPHTY